MWTVVGRLRLGLPTTRRLPNGYWILTSVERVQCGTLHKLQSYFIMRAFVFTSDKTLWALQSFAHLWHKYVGEVWPVIVCGFTRPTFTLPHYFAFHSIGDFADYPVQQWSNAIMKVMSEIEDEIVLTTFDDFWVARKVDTEAVKMLDRYMRVEKPYAARVDLTTDRLYGANLLEVGAYDRLDIISNDFPIPYLFSWQTGLWRRTELLKYLRPNETPWQSELSGTTRMHEGRATVYGTRQAPMRYLIAVQQGKLAFDGGYQVPRVPFTDWDELRELGYLEGAKDYAA